jgi:ATP-binding cassette subfamily B protein
MKNIGKQDLNNSLSEIFIEQLRNGRLIRMAVKGRSMYPIINKGDYLTVKPIKFNQVKVGDIIVYRKFSQAEFTVHRILKKGIDVGGQYLLTKGDANIHLDQLVYSQDVYGKVIVIEKKNGRINLETVFQRLQGYLMAKYFRIRILFNTVNKFCRYLFPYWKKEVLILFLSGASVILGLINPYLTKLIIDKAYANKDLKLFIIMIIAGGIVFILSGAVSALSNYLNRYIRQRVKFDLNRRMFGKLQNLPYTFFIRTSTGENLFKISYDIDHGAHFITEVLPRLVSLFPRSVFIFAIVLYLEPNMALFALALMPFLYLSPCYFIHRLKKALQGWVEDSEVIFDRVQEVLSRMQLVKVFGKEKFEARRHIRRMIKNTRIFLKNSKLEAVSFVAANAVSRLILGLIIFYGGYQVITNKMSLGSLTAITIYLSQLAGLQNSLIQFFQPLGSISAARVQKIFDSQPSSLEERQAREILLPEGTIVFRGITFGYLPEEPVLQNLSFRIRGGSCVGLVGHSGCGKSTLVNLLLRLYKPHKGRIFIDAEDIIRIKAVSFYRQIGVALQEPWLWNDTIENNIRYGCQEASFEEIKEAARISCVDDFIIGLPQGYDTVIGENACRISQGQKQRIALARAVIKKPRVLILDEALSCVDAQTEDRIINNLKKIFTDTTLIIISHRLSTIKKMDLIYFLAGPDKIDINTHQGLLDNNIKYRNYLATQTDACIVEQKIKELVC